MNTIKDLGIVKSSLASILTSITSLKTKIEDLQTNKADVSSAWQSTNADDYISQYDTLINHLNDAFESLENYQKKVEQVVQEIEGFDKSITTSGGQGGHGGNIRMTQ